MMFFIKYKEAALMPDLKSIPSNYTAKNSVC